MITATNTETTASSDPMTTIASSQVAFAAASQTAGLVMKNEIAMNRP